MFLLDGGISGEPAIVGNQSIYFCVVDFPNNEFHRVPIQRMSEATEFPRAEMARQEDNTVAALDGVLVVLETFVSDVLRDVVLVEVGEVAELDKQASQIRERGAKDFLAPLVGEFRHCHLQIANAGTALPAGKSIAEGRD